MSAGDVYTYHPEDHHCTEGLAIEHANGRLIDWFWSGNVVSHRQYVERDADGLTLIANLNDYELTPRMGRESSRDYAPEDRLLITSQHGLQVTNYIRKGSKPDLITRLKNAHAVLDEAREEERKAHWRVERALEKLTELEKDFDNE